VASKNPELFVRVIARLLPRRDDLAVLFTRDFAPDSPGGPEVARLAELFPQQVTLGRNMPLDDYYAALWAADLQVSTATHESLGVSTLEGMYTGNCCILPRLGSYPEICNNHPDVLYDLAEDALEERLRFFLEHPRRRQEVATELQRLANRYRAETVAAKIGQTLRDAIESR
jgi:glycosyltransferase involved in cell wall biosynthesis